MKTKTRKIRRMKRKYNKKTKNAKRGGFTDYFKKYMYSDPAAATPLPSNPEINTTNPEINTTNPEINTTTPGINTTNPGINTPPPEIYTTNQSQTPKKYSSLTSGVRTSLTRSAKAYNMPAILGAISTKINALLIHNKVNYKFSNGFNASDYDIESVTANGDNDGRGILKENAKREEITGLQSKLYNMGTDGYDKYKNKQSNGNTEPNKL
jgi:hypothetical protein